MTLRSQKPECTVGVQEQGRNKTPCACPWGPHGKMPRLRATSAGTATGKKSPVRVPQLIQTGRCPQADLQAGWGGSGRQLPWGRRVLTIFHPLPLTILPVPVDMTRSHSLGRGRGQAWAHLSTSFRRFYAGTSKSSWKMEAKDNLLLV